MGLGIGIMSLLVASYFSAWWIRSLAPGALGLAAYGVVSGTVDILSNVLFGDTFRVRGKEQTVRALVILAEIVALVAGIFQILQTLKVIK